jgi:hypothetical protein
LRKSCQVGEGRRVQLLKWLGTDESSPIGFLPFKVDRVDWPIHEMQTSHRIMRKAIFAFFLLLGIGCGLLSTWNDDWGMRIVMMAVGALFGAAIGGGLSQIGKANGMPLTRTDEEMFPGGLGTSSRDLAANFWRDRGHMPFMKPPRPEHGLQMFDADKNV